MPVLHSKPSPINLLEPILLVVVVDTAIISMRRRFATDLLCLIVRACSSDNVHWLGELPA